MRDIDSSRRYDVKIYEQVDEALLQRLCAEGTIPHVRAVAVRIAKKRNEQARVEREQRELLAREAAASRAAQLEDDKARRQAQIDTWVAEHGSANQQGRHALGLLPEQEVLDAIRSTAYAGLDQFARYDRIEVADLPHEDGCYQSDLDCETEPAEDLSAEEYDRFQAIREAMPEGGTITALDHSCVCTDCGAALVRSSAKVMITVGAICFSREYAL